MMGVQDSHPGFLSGGLWVSRNLLQESPGFQDLFSRGGRVVNRILEIRVKEMNKREEFGDGSGEPSPVEHSY